MKTNKGFTLIELMIVVAIIGILSAIAIPKFADLIRKSNEGATKGNLGAVRSALSIYYGEQDGKYPTSATGLGDTLTMQNGKYIKAMPVAYCAGYTDKTSHVTAATSTGTGTLGDWAYNETIGASGSAVGDFWVDLKWTDSKGTNWDAY